MVETKPAWYHLVVSSRGLVVFAQRILVDRPYLLVRIPQSEMNLGVNQIALLDNELIPISNRLVFIEKKGGVKLELTTDKEKYKKRDLVQVTIKASSFDGQPIRGTALSVLQPIRDWPCPSRNTHEIFTHGCCLIPTLRATSKTLHTILKAVTKEQMNTSICL